MKGLKKDNAILDNWFTLEGGKWKKAKTSTLKDWIFSENNTGIVLQATIKKPRKKKT